MLMRLTTSNYLRRNINFVEKDGLSLKPLDFSKYSPKKSCFGAREVPCKFNEFACIFHIISMGYCWVLA